MFCSFYHTGLSSPLLNPKFFNAFTNGIFKFLFWISLLTYGNTTNFVCWFYILLLCWIWLLVLTGFVSVESLGFCTCKVISLANIILLLSFQFDTFSSFSCLIALARSSSIVLSRISKSRHLFLFLIFEEKPLVFCHQVRCFLYFHISYVVFIFT